MPSFFRYIKDSLRILLSKKVVFICFNESPLKMVINAFYFMLKAFSVLETFAFFSLLIDYIEK